MTSSMEEVPCCVCGEWVVTARLLDVSLLRMDVRRKHVSGMLEEKPLCNDCSARCDQCKKTVIRAQRQACQGLCVQCWKPKGMKKV